MKLIGITGKAKIIHEKYFISSKDKFKGRINNGQEKELRLSKSKKIRNGELELL